MAWIARLSLDRALSGLYRGYSLLCEGIIRDAEGRDRTLEDCGRFSSQGVLLERVLGF